MGIKKGRMVKGLDYGISRTETMNITEMNNRIGQIKEEQREIQNELRKGNEAEQKSLKEAHNHRMTQQQETYDQRISDFKKSNTERLKRYDNDTREAIDGKVNVFKNEVHSQREKFERERRMENEKLSRELNNVKDSYRRTIKERELNHKNMSDRLENRLTNNLMRSKKEFESDVDRLGKQSHTNLERSKEGFSKEKYQLKKDNIERETNMAHEMRKRDIGSRQKHNEQVDRMRNTYQRQIVGLKDLNQAAREKSIRNHQAQNTTMLDNFAKRENNINLVNRVEHERKDEQFKGSVDGMKKGFAKRLNNVNRKALAMAQANDLGVTERLRNERVRNSYESRLKNMKLDLEKTIKGSLAEKDKIGKEYKSVIENRNAYNSKKRMETEMRTALDANERVSKVRGDRNKMERYLTSEIKGQKRSFDHQIGSEQDYRKDLLTSQREKFSDQIVRMSDKNRESVNRLQSNYTDEKASMIDKQQKMMHERLRSVSEDHAKKVESMIDGYESRLFTKNQELLRLKALFETRMKGLEDKSVKDYRREKEMELERSKADSRSASRTLRIRERTNNKQLLSAKRFFDRQILNLKTKNDSEMAKTIRDYESRIEKLNLDNRKKLSGKLQVARDEYLKLVEQSEVKHDALRSQYETRFNKLKMAMEKMKDSRAINA
jgi:hypothetical protein